LQRVSISGRALGGREVVAASSKSGINTISGGWLKEAMADATVVIDLANSPSFEDNAVMEFVETSFRPGLCALHQHFGRKHCHWNLLGA
jgi:hypothetical protein